MSSLKERKQARERQEDQDCARADFAVHLTAMATGVSQAEITGSSRHARAARARQIAMYLTQVGYGLTLSRVGAAFGRDRATVAHALRQVEAQRDDPDTDQLLAGLETALRNTPTWRFP